MYVGYCGCFYFVFVYKVSDFVMFVKKQSFTNVEYFDFYEFTSFVFELYS